MKPLPKSTAELLTEVTKLGLHNANAKIDTPRKKLLDSIWSSFLIRRSISQSSILLVGSSGVGKSSTVNHLLNLTNDNEIAKTSDKKSETSITTEYKVDSDYPSYDVNNLTLGVVDSPGFNDTSGIKQDVCNFFSIKRFYTEHPNLRGCYPNIIFVLVLATDTRISGPNSNLSKSLRCLGKLNLVDKKHPNVIGILTWSASIPGSGNRKKWKMKIDEKKKILNDVIFQCLNIKAPIVAIENDVEDNELEIVDDYSRLPDGELQPKNLYEACAELLINSGDSLGHIILNACFLKPKKPSVGFVVPAKDASDINCKFTTEEKKFLKDLKDSAQGGIEDQLVYNAQTFIETEMLSEEDSDKVQQCVGKIKALGVEDIEDLKYIRSGCITNGEALSEIETTFLRELNVQFPPVSIGSSSIIGQGYNIKKDEIVSSQILEMEIVDSGHGVFIPKFAKFEKLNESPIYMNIFEDKIAMARSRMAQLNIELSIDYSQLNFEERAGAMIKTPDHARQISVIQEERTFKLKIANLKDENVEFTADFKSEVEKLPETYDANNVGNRRQYERFFDKWGQFIIASAYGGGSIESKIESKYITEENILFDQLRETMVTAFNPEMVNTVLNSDFPNEKKDESKIQSIINTSAFTRVGGDSKLWYNSTIKDPETIRKWKLSLMEHPAMLETELYLEPISILIGCIDPCKEENTLRAIKDYIGGEFNLIEYQEERLRVEQKGKNKAEEEANPEVTKRESTVKDPIPLGKKIVLSMLFSVAYPIMLATTYIVLPAVTVGAAVGAVIGAAKGSGVIDGARAGYELVDNVTTATKLKISRAVVNKVLGEKVLTVIENDLAYMIKRTKQI